MAGIAGIVNRDGMPCDRALVDALASAIAFRAPAGIHVVVAGPAGLASLCSRTPPPGESGALPTQSLRYVAAFDGRIDNREELARRIGAMALTMEDADLVRTLFAREGDDAFARIEGDFAVAIWDRETRVLTCARDTWGVRPFVYWEFGRSFVFASEIAALRAIPGHAPEPDETMVVEHLAIDIRSGGRTLYTGVKRLEPAHLLRVEAERSTLRRYWSYDATKTLRLRTDEEYADAFLDVFSASVRARIDPRTTGCELSGGIDSSSVTAVAESIVPGRVEAFSLVFPGMECDESEYVDAVCAASGVRSHRVGRHERTGPDLLAEVLDLHDAADLPNGAMHRAVYECAASRGAGVLLTGIGGDDWFQGSHPVAHLAELLCEGRVREAWRTDGGRGVLAGLRMLASESPAGPSLRATRRLLRGGAPTLERPRWIRPAFWSRSGAEEVLSAEPPPLRGSPARIATLRNGDSAWPVWGAERAERLAARSGVELRHPFLDRRVRELGLSLPEDQRNRQGLTRYVVRNSMKKFLPERVRSRRTKADFTVPLLAAIRAPGVAELLENLTVEERGWVDGEWIRDLWAKLCARDRLDTEAGFGLWAIPMTISLEAWHRRLFA